METTRFQVYKINAKGNKTSLILMAIMSIVGLLGILIILFSGNPEFLKLKINSYVLFLLQGLLGIVLVRNTIKNEKYFVSLKDDEIQYLLPKNKELETIRIQDIQSIEKTNRDFRIMLKNNEIKNFSFYYFYFPTRQTIIDYFESLKARVENLSVI
jgi:hypothetical protein